jgi:hypothetical protein
MKARLLFALLLLIAAASVARADTIYAYQGSAFGAFDQFGFPNSCPSCAISGWFTLPAPFIGGTSGTPVDIGAPLQFQFTDGLRTFTPSTTTFADFKLSTDLVGQIQYWDVEFLNSYFIPLCCEIHDGLATWNYGGPSIHGPSADAEDDSLVDFGANVVGPSAGINHDEPGTWTITTPEPSTSLQLGLGLVLLLILMALRGKSKAPSQESRV